MPLALVIAIAAAASGGKKSTTTGTTDTTKAAGEPETTAKAAAPSKGSYALGDTAKTGDFEVTVYGFKDPQATSNQFDKPKAGNHFVSVDVQVANKGSKQQTFSSLAGLHLVDGANRQYDVSFSTLTPGPPDGEIPAGEAVRGFAVFDVPDGTTGLRLRVQGSFTAAGAFFSLG